MRNYSICYLDALGRTRRSELLEFEGDDAAIGHARAGLIGNAIVEVWRNNTLVTRLYQAASPTIAAKRSRGFTPTSGRHEYGRASRDALARAEQTSSPQRAGAAR